MKKNIELNLEAFGGKRLTAIFSPEELIGKKVDDVIKMVINREWKGEDKYTLEIIKREMSSSNGYTTSVARDGIDAPVRFQPVKLDAQVQEYVQDIGFLENKLRLSVTGDHVVGKYG